MWKKFGPGPPSFGQNLKEGIFSQENAPTDKTTKHYINISLYNLTCSFDAQAELFHAPCSDQGCLGPRIGSNSLGFVGHLFDALKSVTFTLKWHVDYFNLTLRNIATINFLNNLSYRDRWNIISPQFPSWLLSDPSDPSFWSVWSFQCPG